MSVNTWVETLITSQSDGAALSGTSAASILPAQAKFTLPSNYFEKIGKGLRIKAMGRVSNIVTTPGTLTLDVRLNTTPIIVFNGGAMQLNAVAKTNVTWWLEILLTCRAIGSGTSANLMGIGQWSSESVVGSPVPGTGGSGQLSMPASAPAVGTGFDSTVTNIVDLFGTFSLTGNSLTLHEYFLESLN
jgi:hypothetical protein